MEIKSPVKKLFKEKKMAVQTFASLGKIGYIKAYRCFSGAAKKIPLDVLKTMQQLWPDVDVDRLQRDYKFYKRASELKSGLLSMADRYNKSREE